MQTMERYLELVENGRPIDEETYSIPCVKQSLMALLERADASGGLALEGAWRLEGSVARTLETETGYVPAGGWRGVSSLAAGCGVLKASKETFEPSIDAAELARWSSRESTRQLLESFTRRLVPPTTAAGLFILLGLHPAWGVHVAHRSHCRFGDRERPSPTQANRHADLFAESTLEVVEELVFTAVASIVATMRALEPHEKYAIDALSGVIEAFCRKLRRDVEKREPDGGWRGLAPLVDVETSGRSKWRVIDFTTADLIDAFLVPAGAAHRFNDDAFCVVPDAFEGVRVGEIEATEQHERLVKLLTGAPRCSVA